jgi:hypothetical protein
MADHLIVALIAAISGGFAIPIGFLLGLPPIESYPAAVAGALGGLFLFVFVGAGLRSWTVRKANVSDEQLAKGRAAFGQYGVKGLGFVGPILPGVTVSVLIGLAAGVDRKELASWMSLGVLAMYAVYVVGLWILVEVFGI